jgi:CMP-N,N'-diacetyllegionaminic acid synthase
MMDILCIIPARSGSKGIQHKNIKDLAGKPLMAWSIEQALLSKYKMKVLVSTDSEEYRQIAIKYGAEAPFLRPTEISQDLSTDLELVEHCLEYLEENENYSPDFIVQLRPTYPTRKVSILNETIKIFLEKRCQGRDSLRTIIPFEKSPFKMYTMNGNNLEPLFKNLGDIKEPYNQCRQNLPQAYLHNGYIDIFNTNIVKDDKISGDNIYGYVMSKNEYHDIDSIEDFEIVEKLILDNK